jgi:voltage-gated potassium channel Kch
VADLKLIERGLTRFLEEPPSVRTAVRMIVLTTAAVVVGGGVLMFVLDHSEYPNIGRGLWWAMQTVTTVGYGDVTPAHPAGRFVGVVVMLWGIAFLSILIAGVTSTFVARAEEERARADHAAEQTEEELLMARLDDLAARLERIERSLSASSPRPGEAGSPGPG